VSGLGRGDTLYWTTYHAYFAALGDPEHRGHQVSAREALVSAVSIVGPILGGWGITHLGPAAAFGGVALVQTLAALPLLASPDVAIARTAPGAIRASRMGFAICVTDGWVSAGYYVGWQLLLFLILKESFTAYGGALALAGIVGAMAGLVLGKLVDLGHGAKAATLAFAVFAAYTLARSATATIPMALILNALGALAGSLYVPPMATAVYNLAKASPCPLRFHMVTEGAYDIGGGLGCLFAAGLLVAGVPLNLDPAHLDHRRGGNPVLPAPLLRRRGSVVLVGQPVRRPHFLKPGGGAFKLEGAVALGIEPGRVGFRENNELGPGLVEFINQGDQAPGLSRRFAVSFGRSCRKTVWN